MADFNTKTNFDPNAPNWTGASRQPERSMYQANQTYGKLFEGVGEAVTGVTNVAYQNIVDKAEKRWDELFTPVRDAQGVGEVTQAANVGLETPGKQPQELSNMAARATKLNEAMQEGRIGNTYYYAQLNSLVKEMKTQFPGFHREVDQIVQKTTGVIPANALRNSILAELEKNQSAAEKRAEEERKNVDGYMHLWPQAMAQRYQQTGQKPTWQELQPFVQQRLAEEQQVKFEKSRLELMKSRGEATTQDLQQGLKTNARIEISRVFDEALMGVNSKIVSATKSGQPMSPEALNEVTTQMNILVGQAGVLWDRMVNRADKDGKSWAELINDPAKLEAEKKLFLGQFESIRDMITNDKLGAATMAARMTKSQRDTELYQIYKNNDTMRKLGAISEMPGSQVFMQWWLNSQAQGSKTGGKILNEISSVFMTDTASGSGSLPQQLKDARVQGAGPGFYKKLISDYADALSRQEISPEIKSNFTKTLFAEYDSLKHFDNRSKERVFSQLTSPAITQEMLKVRERDPAAWDRYQNWAKNSFFQVFRQLTDNVGSAETQKYVDVSFDPKTNQFVAAPNAEGIKYAQQLLDARKRAGMTPSDTNPMTLLKNSSNSLTEYLQSTQKLNSAIKSIEPILKADGHDVGKEMMGLLKAKGVDTTKPKTGGLLDGLGRAVGDALGPNKAGAAEGPASFGGQPLNFQSASRDNKGPGSLASLEGSEINNTRGADLKNLDDRTKQFLDDLASDGVIDALEITSGYRDPERNRRAGGAKASKHMDGLAIDLDVRGLTDEQKAAVLDAAIKRGAKGVGIYPGGNSIHLDLRQEPATWGFSNFGRYKGTTWDQQPPWAHGPLKKLFGVS